MTPRTPALALALATLLAGGCPIPQTAAEFPEGSPITPPRIVAESVTPAGTVIQVPAACPASPEYPLYAQIVDEDTAEPVGARIFVDYDATLQAWYDPSQEFPVPVAADPDETRRDVVPPEPFRPYGQPVSPVQSAAGFTDPTAPGIMHVVELVVSNGFAPLEDEPASPLPYRTPLPGFETQVHRWIFLLVDDPAIPCPP